MDKHYFNLTPDTMYTNKGGGSYICLGAEGDFRAKFQRVASTSEPASRRSRIFPCVQFRQFIMTPEQRVLAAECIAAFSIQLIEE